MKIFKGYWNNYAQDDIMTSVRYRINIISRTDAEIIKQNPGLYSDLYKLEKAILEVTEVYPRELIHDIWDKYKERIGRYICKKAKDQGGYFPMLDPTKTLYELIARGWVHSSQASFEKDDIQIICHVGPLVWPDGFKIHQDALACLNRVGIHGRTGTILPKR